MEFQDYEVGNVIDMWDPPPFSPLPPLPPSQNLCNIITKDDGISQVTWDQFIGSDVPNIAF